MLDKTYQPNEVEARIYQAWEDAGAFAAGAGKKDGEDAYCIVIPPPNVTGSLHMGHALNNTLQDALIRWQRMQGKDVLWQPGMDHAGIATQMVVERQLAANNEPGRRDMGREAFVERVWDWKAESGGTIFNQLRRLGASCDWSRERFTMDEGLSKAVLKVFVELYKKDLIYKDKRLVNWDPKFMTAISDLEVEQIEKDGFLWHLAYPVEGEEGRTITVATTRPETMLGDTCVIVHPEDERYKDLVGKHVILPLVGRRIPIIADDYVDMETGTGAMKVTPAHDFNDFDIGKRHNQPMINVMSREADIWLKDNEDFLRDVPESQELAATIAALDGMERFAARAKVVEMFEARDLLVEIVPHRHMVPHGDRSGVPIEPFLTDQWYVDAETLAKPALASVREGRTQFVPKNWEKTYFNWLENIQPWCISRQLWWGHRIPAWYGPDGKTFVELTEEAANAAAEAHYGKAVELTRDEDVLDTWFSSALWPFSTLGWPDKTPELQKYYQTDVLITGFDIIFFWVARMMMFSLEFMDEEPFHTVYIHALVRDEKGAKMSKSKGNVINPLDLIEEYGADAVRFTLTAMAAQGRDIKLAKSRVEGYRNFCTKLWNATRFAEMNECRRVEGFDPAGVNEPLNRWIIGEVSKAAAAVSDNLITYKFDQAAGSIYRFTWNAFCDWYLELAKPIFGGDDEAAKAETRATAAWVLDQILKILHPFMPFITEELWEKTAIGGAPRAQLLALTAWPDLSGLGDDKAEADVNWLIDLVTAIRSTRADMRVPAGAKVPLVLLESTDLTAERLQRHDSAIQRLARIEAISTASEAPSGSARVVMGGEVFALALDGIIDIAEEKKRLQGEIEKLNKDIGKIDAKLANEKFTSRAPAEVVEEQKERRATAEDRKAKMQEALESLA